MGATPAGVIESLESILGLLKSLEIRALVSAVNPSVDQSPANVLKRSFSSCLGTTKYIYLEYNSVCPLVQIGTPHSDLARFLRIYLCSIGLKPPESIFCPI
jgi:hypothetical protein